MFDRILNPHMKIKKPLVNFTAQKIKFPIKVFCGFGHIY